MPRRMPTTLRLRFSRSSPRRKPPPSRSKSAAAVPEIDTPSRTVRPPFRLFDPFSAGLLRFQPNGSSTAPVRTPVATEFNPGERYYHTINRPLPSIRNSPLRDCRVKMDSGGRRLETLRVFGAAGGHHITQAYGRHGAGENFARGTGILRSLHGGRMPAFARCCFCIAASRLVFTSPIRFPFRRIVYHIQFAADGTYSNM